MTHISRDMTHISFYVVLCAFWQTSSTLGTSSIGGCVCNAGYVKDSKGEECAACAAGTYKAEASSAACGKCAEHAFSAGNVYIVS